MSTPTPIPTLTTCRATPLHSGSKSMRIVCTQSAPQQQTKRSAGWQRFQSCLRMTDADQRVGRFAASRSAYATSLRNCHARLPKAQTPHSAITAHFTCAEQDRHDEHAMFYGTTRPDSEGYQHCLDSAAHVFAQNNVTTANEGYVSSAADICYQIYIKHQQQRCTVKAPAQ